MAFSSSVVINVASLAFTFETNQVNEAVRKKENTERLEWIQNHVQCDGSAEVLQLMTTVFESSPAFQDTIRRLQNI